MNRTLWKIWWLLGREYGRCAYFPAYRRRRDGRVFFWFHQWHEATNGRPSFQPHYDR